MGSGNARHLVPEDFCWVVFLVWILAKIFVGIFSEMGIYSFQIADVLRIKVNRVAVLGAETIEQLGKSALRTMLPVDEWGNDGDAHVTNSGRIGDRPAASDKGDVTLVEYTAQPWCGFMRSGACVAFRIGGRKRRGARSILGWPYE